ncbi:stress response protein [Aeromicrobium senzhongii]|uniref:Stress response protein n=1 Tax=Aeromicrobium senzhongii TaxID=2663859 RepID=A0ABX6SV46_9ACTN|nr:stress response protein [Aeromicrobium senzhongii]MTB87710.1 stress response protein [Aeromicrobium senzhongii]QNL95258.1 stress response protein [Aeromicrobium senzhongii]
MSEEAWHEARLIPTSGINGAQEQEKRATSALLAVMGAVPEFSKALLSPLGAPARVPATYIEVPFDLSGKKVIPDGLIRVTRGSKTWTALVEVKTGKNELQTEQLDNYLDVARGEGFDALITISNEVPSLPGVHPTPVDKRKLRKVQIFHWSWSYVLSTAIVQKEHRGISDPDQAWILGELIRYLEHDRSGALEFDDMGPNWVSIRDAVAAGTLRANDKVAPEVIARFDALLQYLALRLGRRLGIDVSQVVDRKSATNPTAYLADRMNDLAANGTLTGSLRIPNAVGHLVVTADLRANLITSHVELDAPKEGRQTTRVNWLLRQLRDAPDSARVESFAVRSRTGNAELLSVAREDPKLLAPDPSKELRSFRVAMDSKAGAKRGSGQGSFIDSVVKSVDQFYGEVMQNLKAWTPTAPKMRPEVPAAEDGLRSVSLSSQDGPASSAP